MQKDGKKSTGHSILRYRVRLYDRHFNWLVNTCRLYEQVAAHFFDVLKQEPELLALSDFLLLRELEKCCIGTKEMKTEGVLPKYPLQNLPKIPLYFRRSAINAAIDLARKGAGTVAPHMVLYKGMYQNFTNQSIELKLFNGEKWVWVTYPFAGRELPPEAEWLSPMLVLERKNAWLEVPVSFEVADVRTVKERMKTEERICAVSFPDNDVLATAVVLSRDGEELEHRFFRGGNRRNDRRRRILGKIKKSEESRGKKAAKQKQQEAVDGVTGETILPERENAVWYKELEQLNNHYVHLISQRIVEFCLEQQVRVIIVPNYETGIDFRDKRYLKTDAYRWLGRSIIRKLKYKAFKEGIVVTSIRPVHITDCCSECGAGIQRYNEGHSAGKNYYGGKLFVCPNGHKGNVARNSAKNIGRNFLSYYPVPDKKNHE